MSSYPNIVFHNIVVFKEMTNEEVEKIRKWFDENDYVLIKDILTTEIKKYLLHNINYDSEVLKDPRQFYREHHDVPCTDLINEFLKAVQPFYTFILKRNLSHFAGFSMKYNEESNLIPHYDNYNMPISSTMCFYNQDRIPYPIYIDTAYFNNPHPFRVTIYDDISNIPNENIVPIDINEGDIGLFRGRNHLHWRGKVDIKDYRAILLHMEDYTYNGELVGYTMGNANINDVKNINTYALTDIQGYDKFRKDYVMYFVNS